MSDLHAPIATAGSTTLTLGDFLATLHRRQRLRPLIMEVVTEQMLVDEARRAGLTVSDEQLQRAVNAFRLRQGLHSIARTNQWLTEQGLSLVDLEVSLESELLINMLQQHVTENQLEKHFADHREDFARARVRLLVVASEGEAREMYTLLTEEGRDFAELARQHSLHLPTRATGGVLPPVYRFQLPADVMQAVFNARPDTVVGPHAAPTGFSLHLVEELLPAELDSATMNIIRRRLFDGYVRERFADVRLDLSWLDREHASA